MNFFKIFNKKIVVTGKISKNIKIIYFKVYQYFLQRHLRGKVRNKRKVNISFLMVSLDIWKLDSVVLQMLYDPCFEVKVIICPFISQGEEIEKINGEKSIKYFTSKKIPFEVGCYSKCNADFFLQQSDIIFYTNPNHHTLQKYMYYNWTHKLTCFNIYSFRVSSYYEYEYNSPIMITAWRNYIETDYHYQLSVKYGSMHNLKVTGYPKFQEYLNTPSDKFKKQKKIIMYAPHWTIRSAQKSGLDWSTFLEYGETIIDFINLNKETTELIFKPHPMLRSTLEKEEVWGKFKTDSFFNKLYSMSNVKVVVNEGYSEYFINSDALIHDSGGFTVEYLLMNKPCGFLLNSKLNNNYNLIGKEAISLHHNLHTKEEVINFLYGVLNNECGIKRGHGEFINSLLKHGLPSDLIIQDIKKHLCIN